MTEFSLIGVSKPHLPAFTEGRNVLARYQGNRKGDPGSVHIRWLVLRAHVVAGHLRNEIPTDDQCILLNPLSLILTICSSGFSVTTGGTYFDGLPSG